MESYNLYNISSDDGLVPDDTKPLHELMLPSYKNEGKYFIASLG